MDYQQRESFGKRFGRFLTLCIILSAAVFGVTAWLRFNTETLALLTGGLLVFMALVVLLTFGLALYYIRARFQSVRPAQQQAPAYHVPPIYIQAPQAQPALPNYGGNYGGSYNDYGSNNTGWGFEQSQGSGGRAWEIIGGEEAD